MKKTLVKRQERQTTLQSKPAQQVIQNMIVSPSRVESVDVDTWRNAINSALRGNRIPLYNLYSNLLSDAVLADALDRLTDSVTNAEIMFQVNGKSIDEIEDLMETIAFEKLLKEIALKFAWGKSLIETSFSPEFSVFSIPRKNIRITNLDKPLKERKRFIATKETDKEGYDYTQDEFIIECGEDEDLGFLFRAALPAIYKRGGWGDWAQFVELFAMPFLTAEYEGFDTNVRDALFEALAAIGSNPFAAVPKGVNLEVHASNSGSGDTYDNFTDKCDKQMLIAILGNTMTTIDGSSKSQGQVHQETQEARFKRIRRYTQRVLNSQFLPLLIKRGYNVAGGYFSFPDAGETISTKERLEMGLSMRAADLPVDEDWFFEVTGVAKATTPKEDTEPEKTKEEEKQPEPTPEPPTPEPEPEKKPVIQNSNDEVVSLGVLDKVFNFFADAPTAWSGAIKRYSRKLKSRITGKITLSDDYSIDINKLIQQAINEVYGNKGEKELVNESLFEATNKPLQHAVDTELKGFVTENPEFVKQFKESTAVFAAFKNYQQTQLFVDALRDEEGKIRSYYQFRKECLKIGEKFNEQYLKTEYSTLVKSLRMAANLKDMEKILHLYPNLEYVESNASDKRESHLKYVGIVLPFHHPAWSWLMPPQEWNCDCSVRLTDKPVTAAPVKPEGFDPIFDNNPLESGEFINIKETPYYKHTDESLRGKIEDLAKRLQNEAETTEKEVYKGKKGGFVEIVKQNSNEREKNLTTYKLLADRGGKYSLLDETKIEGVKNPDAFNLKDGFFSDAKHPVTESGKNAIQNSISAASKQNVEEVVIRLDKEYSSTELHEGFKAALQRGRAESLTKIILIRKNKEPLYFNVDQLRKLFAKKK